MIQSCSFVSNQAVYGKDIYHGGFNILIRDNIFDSTTISKVRFFDLDAFLTNNTNLNHSMF